MNFNNLSYLVPILVFLVIFCFFYFKFKKSFLNWVEDHWFYKPSFANKLSSLLYLSGLTLITLALLDLRGPEKRVKGIAQSQKTIILIDSSASMLAEDVRPNRFSKALLLVKHYVKKAAGQQISLVVFSDNQKRIIPFTKDIDLINARIGSLENLNLGRGGTGLSQAIQESVEYFRSSQGELSGNILIFSDAEETELSFDLKVPDEITVAMIGVGTLKGAPIPLRNSRGEFTGNKKFKGQVVISKLSEKMLEGLGDKIKNYKFWTATSYSLPTEEILSFFNRVDDAKKSKTQYRIKPVLSNYLLIPGVLILLFSFLLNFRNTFVMGSLLFLSTNLYAQNNAERPSEPVKSEQTIKLEIFFSENKLDYKGKKKLAESLFADGFPNEAALLYDEVLSKKITKDEVRDKSNQALSLLSSDKKDVGIDMLEDVIDYLKKNNVEGGEALQKEVEKNLLKAIEENSGKGSEKDKDQKKDKDKTESKDKDGDGDDSSSDQDKSDGEQKKPQDDPKEGSGSEKEDEKKKNDDSSDEEKDKEKKKKNEELSEGNQKAKKIDKKKLPAILKQLINDDNQLQKKAIDAKTVERKSRDKKDW